MSMAPGWYPDPFSSSYHRWWDGQGWTPRTRVTEERGGEPVAPVPPAGGPTYPTPPPPPGAGYPLAPAPPYAQPPRPAQGAPSGEPPGPPPQQEAPPGAPRAPWTPYAAYPPPPVAAPFALARWGSRVAARLVDWVLVGLVLAPFYVSALWPPLRDLVDSLPADGSTIPPEAVATFQNRVVGEAVTLGLLTGLVMLAYEVPQLALWGRTVGKRVLGLRVRAVAEDRGPRWGEAFARSGVMAVGYLVGGGLFLLLDGLWPLWDKPWQQAIHDKLARTVVVPAERHPPIR